MTHEYRIFDASTDLETDAQKLERLYHEIKAHEHHHYMLEQDADTPEGVIDAIELELTEKINEYEALGGTFD